MLSLIKIKRIHKCEDTDHVYAFVKTGPRATHLVRTGDLVPTGTMLVTLILNNVNAQVCFITEWKLHANAYLSVSTPSFVELYSKTK